ncbi:hypothetical protein [Nocardioides sp. LHG3406-4]|uniref:hypothetical protein n=1 Tax=Nocardioides sp. LHG3406-4 TaxID=2804575 RepID=UPI003CF5693A
MSGDLLTMLRVHDLPPTWDGLAVLWSGWEYASPGLFICPPPLREVCEGCGLPTTERGFPAWSTNRGLVAVSAVLTHDDLRYEEENRARLGALAHRRKPRALFRLHAFRCHSCSLDDIWDTDTDEWWTLDHTDYGDDGSTG